ncbi:MAG: hypothetical protein M5U14_07160 [Acidimicrobiia bacterium]|nr:hypothetical protein [Acidimicrobiia bacterium]
MATRRSRSWRARATYLAYRAAAGAAQVVPRPIAEPSARLLGRALGRAMVGRRRMVARHLRRAGLEGPALGRAVGGAFDSYGRYWLELFRLPREAGDSLEEHLDLEGFEHIAEGRRPAGA